MYKAINIHPVVLRITPSKRERCVARQISIRALRAASTDGPALTQYAYVTSPQSHDLMALGH